MKFFWPLACLLLCLLTCPAVRGQVSASPSTFCNPINLDYGYTPIPNFSTWGRHRATADPVIVPYKGDYYLFSTNQWGYWHSPDLNRWHFVPRKFLRPWNPEYDELCAPAVGVLGDTMIVFGSTYTSRFTLWMSTNPRAGEWKPLVDSFEIGGWDPDFFVDADGRLYMYNGSSNRYPIYGIELDRSTFRPIGTRKELYALEPWRYGWQRFGEYHDNTFLDPFLEGAHMTRHGNRYYLQYGAPGTEFSGYADGVLVGDHPLGPFRAVSDPLSFKPGGFARGAGHGATFRDPWNNYWHVSTTVINVKNNFERRLSIWPAGFDADGNMWCHTAYGDYPQYLPHVHGARYNGASLDYDALLRPKWMLLNYQKPVQVSGTDGGHKPNYAVDEDIRTYWSAPSGRAGEYFQSDLGELSTVHAVQINYADHRADSAMLGKQQGRFHRYKLLHSTDGRNWQVLVDKSRNQTDVPHDYIELDKPVKTRFLRLENVQMPTGYFALSGFRVFGIGPGSPPEEVGDFMVLRGEQDKRNAWLRWQPVEGAYAYVIYYGTHPCRLTNSIMVYGDNQYWLRTLDRLSSYYFTIEALNEAGIGPRKAAIHVP